MAGMQLEQTVRLSVFAGVLLLVALWEIIAPRRPLLDSKRKRWFTNLSLVGIDTFAVRLLFPILPVALAGVAEARGWGFFNLLQLPPRLAFMLSFLILDFVIYLQHLLFHHLPVLW